MTYAIHSFSLPISMDYLTTPLSPLPVVHIAYKLWYTGKIEDIHYNFPVGVPVMIKDWIAFDEEVKAACESNAESKRLPGDWMSRARPELSPQEFHNLYQQHLHG